MMQSNSSGRAASDSRVFQTMMLMIAAAVSVAMSVTLAGPAEAREVERPFIWMNQDDIDAARERLENEPWAEQAYDRMFTYSRGGQAKSFRRLFDYMVRDDEEAGEKEKQILLQFIDYDVDYRPWSNQSLNALRYDILYDMLTEQERADVEQTMREHVQHAIDTDRSGWNRTSWLPNMQWPRKFSSHLLALALQDRGLIEEIAEASGAWKWYMDEYVADGQFYMEEFGKQYSMVGEMLLWCRGLERLDMNELGFGYEGAGGGTMRRYLESYMAIGYPRVEIPGGMPQYPRVSQGDARRGPKFTFDRDADFPAALAQHTIVAGFLPDRRGGNAYFLGANMNGRDHRWQIVEKMNMPLWFEIAHRQWPEGRFDYFLAQMRHPGDERYLPSLFFGLDPIEPEQVTPPAAPSGVYRERGFAMLRANESEDYWESPDPAVAFQFAFYYVHYTHDAFSLLGYYALNRPIYTNRQISAGYAGGDPWTDSVRGHAGVVVDSLQAKPVDDGNNGTPSHRVRKNFDGPARFLAVQAEGVYPDVNQERALLLTSEYMFDAFWLASDRERVYDWNVHAVGSHHPESGQAWEPTDELDGDALYDDSVEGIAKRLKERGDRYDLKDVQRFDAGDDRWSVDVVQDFAGDDIEQSVLGSAWYEREVGVRVSMLGEPGTRVYTGKTPTSVRHPFEEPETGGVTLLVRREAPATVFAALHEPFEGGAGAHRIDTFEQIARDGDTLAVRIAGDGINDRVLIRLGEEGIGEAVTLEGDDGERFTFVDQAFVRIGEDQVEVMGEVRELRLRVEGEPKLMVNGEAADAERSDGMLHYEQQQ